MEKVANGIILWYHHKHNGSTNAWFFLFALKRAIVSQIILHCVLLNNCSLLEAKRSNCSTNHCAEGKIPGTRIDSAKNGYQLTRPG